jgi:serine/threonine protein kinase
VHVFDEPVAGRYEVEELIGAGAMASVYRAHDRRLERRVALKILHEHCAREPEDITRFRREARAAALGGRWSNKLRSLGRTRPRAR